MISASIVWSTSLCAILLMAAAVAWAARRAERRELSKGIGTEKEHQGPCVSVSSGSLGEDRDAILAYDHDTDILSYEFEQDSRFDWLELR